MVGAARMRLPECHPRKVANHKIESWKSTRQDWAIGIVLSTAGNLPLPSDVFRPRALPAVARPPQKGVV
jgi:hypothetical protein